MTGLPKSSSGTPAFSLAAADAFFGVFGMRRVIVFPATAVCAWCLQPADADHTACQRIAAGGGHG